ncbi:MAG: hypothetical protein AB9828_06500 [Sphaerochaetaceae bacterium]
MLRNQFSCIEERIALMHSCYNRTNKSPAIGFFIGDEYPNIRYPAYMDLPTDRPLEPQDFPIQPFLRNCDQLYEEHKACGGDLFWTATPFWGIPWIEAMLGCDIWYNNVSKTLTAHNYNGQVSLESIPEFSTENPWVQLYCTYIENLSAHSNGRFPIGTTRVRGLADILSTILGGEQFVLKTMLEPEEIIAYLERITPFYQKFMDFQIKQIPLFHGGLGSFYYYNWVPACTIWHQEDSVMLLSPTLYTTFIAPYDKKIYSKNLNHICHFHSTGGYIPYKEILMYKPMAIEMHLDTGGPSAQDLYATHKEILEKSPLIIWGDFSPKDLDWIFSRLSPQGLILSIVVKSSEQAKEIWEKYAK